MAWSLSAFADEADKSCDDQITALKNAGITGMDLRAVDGHNVAALPLEHAQVISQKFQQADIQVAYLASPIGKIDIADDVQEDLKKLRHLGQLKDILGCSRVRIFSYYNASEKSEADWQQKSLDNLKQLRDLAGQLGLVLFHENETGIFGDRLPRIQLLAEQLRDPATFRLIFDFDNFNRDGDDVWHNWQQLKDATDAFHLKDSDKQGQHVPAGQGNGQIKRILADALAAGWEGPLSLEPHLTHSAAVMATGVHGSSNSAYNQMTTQQSFAAAAKIAQSMLGEIGVPLGSLG